MMFYLMNTPWGQHASIYWTCHSLPVGGTIMMTSSNGNIFHVTGPLCREFTSPGEFPTQRPVTQRFDVFFDLCLNKLLSKQPWGWWFETPSWSLWRQCNDKHHSSGDQSPQTPHWQPDDSHLISSCLLSHSWVWYPGFLGHEVQCQWLIVEWETCCCINTLRPRQNGCHLSDDIFKYIFLSLTLFPRVQLIPALVQ